MNYTMLRNTSVLNGNNYDVLQNIILKRFGKLSRTRITNIPVMVVYYSIRLFLRLSVRRNPNGE